MNKQRLTLLILASLGVLATFMPWSSLPVLGAMSGINTKIGKFSLVLFTIPLLGSFIGDRTKDLKGILLYVVVLSSVLSVLFNTVQLWVLTSVDPETSNPIDYILADQIRVDVGLFLALLSGVLIPVLVKIMKESAPNASVNLPKNSDAKKSQFPVRETMKSKPIIQKERPKIDAVNVAKELKNEATKVNAMEPSDHSKYMPK